MVIGPVMVIWPNQSQKAFSQGLPNKSSLNSEEGKPRADDIVHISSLRWKVNISIEAETKSGERSEFSSVWSSESGGHQAKCTFPGLCESIIALLLWLI